jgi:hypothetical protein
MVSYDTHGSCGMTSLPGAALPQSRDKPAPSPKPYCMQKFPHGCRGCGVVETAQRSPSGGGQPAGLSTRRGKSTAYRPLGPMGPMLGGRHDLCCRVIAAAWTPPVSPTQAAAWTTEKALHGRYPLGAALIASEQTPLGIDQRDPDFLQLAGGEAPWSRAPVPLRHRLAPQRVTASALAHPAPAFPASRQPRPGPGRGMVPSTAHYRHGARERRA